MMSIDDLSRTIRPNNDGNNQKQRAEEDQGQEAHDHVKAPFRRQISLSRTADSRLVLRPANICKAVIPRFQFLHICHSFLHRFLFTVARQAGLPFG